jgi:hypothetical protein
LISTSSLDSTTHLTERRRVRLERLLQIIAHDFELRLEFGQRDLLGRDQIVMQLEAEQVALASFNALKGQALHLLGHYLTDSLTWIEAARHQEAQGQPHFGALWHALEDARLENWLVARWPGMQRAFEAKLPPKLGGSLLKLMSLTHQIELGLYLEGRGYRGVQFSSSVRATLDDVAGEIEQGANGETPRASLEAMEIIYPIVALLLRGERGESRRTAPQALEPKRQDAEAREIRPDAREDGRSQEASPDGLPEIEISDEVVSAGVMGRRREFPEWFRPGTAPWFERGLGPKEVHPTAVRTDRQTIVGAPRGDYEVYRALRSEVQREVGFLAHRLTNLIREEVYLRFGGYFRTGKLNMAKLWRQRLGYFRLFQRSITGGQRGVAFTLLVDESASMKGQDKYKIATKTALLLGETLEQIEVPLEIIGYTTADFEARTALQLGLTPAYEYRATRCSPLEHRIYKRFDEPYHVVRMRLTGIQPRHNNWDEEHLLFAFRRIQGRNEQRKVIIVISDGQPNGDAEHLIRTVALLESLGCKIVGVGIGAEFVREIYRNAIVVSDFRQMAEELLQVLAHEFRSSLALSGSPVAALSRM